MVEVVAVYVEGSGKSKPPMDTNAAIRLPPRKLALCGALIG
jgi:hypothetical protein